MSLAIFMMEQATTLHAPLTSTMASWEASASNLLGAVTKGRPVSSDTLEATWRQSLEGALPVHPKVIRGDRKQQAQEGENKMNGGTLQGSVRHPLLPCQNRVTQ